MRIFNSMVAALALTAAALPAQAAQEYKLDLPHTLVTFEIDRQGMTKMLGRFTQFDGGFTLDRDEPANSKISVTIQTESIFTGWEARDNHLRSPDFFNAAEFPTMTFASSKVERTGENTGRIAGELTILGVTRPVTLDVTYNATRTNQRNQTFSGFSATGTINRSDFGMNFLQGPIGDEVLLRLEVLGERL